MEGNGDSRAYDGAIVTLVNLDDEDELRTVHRAGFAWESKVGPRGRQIRTRHVLSFLDVIRRLCREADSWPGTWKIRTICTPLSIYSDLTHARSLGHESSRAQSYEAHVLARADRIDMWEGSYSLDHRERYRQHGLDRDGNPR